MERERHHNTLPHSNLDTLNYSSPMRKPSLARTKSVQSFDDDSPDLEARIINAIGKAGPRNIAQISRLTGAHQETIRYKIKKRFARLGFKFHAVADYSKIGLSAHWGTVNFSKAYRGLAPQVLRALNRVGYLTYYGKMIPQGNYVTLFALPEGTTAQYSEFLLGLKSRGILDDFTLEEVQVSRHKVMDARPFDFRSGRWEVDWAKVAEAPPDPLPLTVRPPPADFDYYDLLVVKELQKDSLQHLTGIARKLKVHQKTLEYHYRTHVQGLGLVHSYRIKWVQDATRKLARSTATTRVAFHGLTKPEFVEAQAAMSKIPFLWLEDLLRDGTYAVMMYIPITEIINTTSYISTSIPNLASRAEMNFVKPDDASAFTIPYTMFMDGEWKFNTRQMEAGLRKEATAPLQR